MPNEPRPQIIRFSPFELDLRAGQLRMGSVPLAVRPKAFAVLQYLAQRPGALVSKEALLGAVWGGAAVSEDVVRLSIRELRSVLGDTVSGSRFIETAPRRGYRFLATAIHASGRSAPKEQDLPASGASERTLVVGRHREGTEVTRWLRAAAGGRRQIGFVTGEAGIGKSTVVEHALRSIQREHPQPIRIARAHCVEQFGSGEPFLPVLEALTALCGGSDGSAVEASLRRFAPGWMLDAMLLRSRDSSERGEVWGGVREHTLHRVANSLDALSDETFLVLVLEDVQWVDDSTLDLLSVIAQRRSAARMAILCTMRPADQTAHARPVARVVGELSRKRLCHELALGALSPVEVTSYLAHRLDGGELPPDVPRLLAERSGGHPLFLVALVEHVLSHRLLAKTGGVWRWRGRDAAGRMLPDELRPLIELRLERLSVEDSAMLEVASVVGRHFEPRAIAAIAPQLGDPDQIEDRCEAMVEASELLERSSTPGHVASTAYVFRHALYRECIYQRLGSAHRRRLHQAIGEYLEAGSGGHAADSVRGPDAPSTRLDAPRDGWPCRR